MLSHTIHPSWYLKLKRFKEDKPVEKILETRIRQWAENKGDDYLPVDRIFPIFGYPGIGKSSLLKYFSEQKGVLFDLKEVKDYNTSIAFIQACEEKIKKAPAYKDKHKLILIDHVPPISDSDYLDEFEQKILIPNLNKNSFFVMAQQIEQTWCWSSAVPHIEPYILHGFSKDQTEELINKLAKDKKVAEQDEKMFEMDEIFPKLIQQWGQNEAKGACQSTDEFLNYWLGEIEPELQVDEIAKALKIAGAMTWLESVLDSEQVQNIADVIHEEISMIRLRSDLGNRGWTGAFGAWYEPIKIMLSIWFQCKHQELADKLNKKFGG